MALQPGLDERGKRPDPQPGRPHLVFDPGAERVVTRVARQSRPKSTIRCTSVRTSSAVGKGTTALIT